ncbi:hypothetical protein [Arthrobacter burdickii]|uniref:DUF1707 domain-containing protein n=1 Tax=Arthrobacter burdickii TaxID=3035920 RepID=A0ABT8JXX9_9MICC|nr:hypothetical protein [Arthrobacter burdickii]MDN4610010.1 hypothetical protein [Arthrobacter burdickii]
MDASSPSSDAERELGELRRRAYGPHSDIQADRAALARLAELETAGTGNPPEGDDTEIDEPAAAAESVPVVDVARTVSAADRRDQAAGIAPVVASSNDPSRSRWHSIWLYATATRAHRSWSVAGTLVVLFALAYSLEWLIGPHSDATLHATEHEADDVVFLMLDVLGADVDRSSLRGYEPYRGVEPWFSVDRQGLQCFMIIDRSGPTVDGANCVPPGVDLFADIGAWPLLGDDSMDGLPDGSIIRFHHRGDSVDVSLYPASEAG